jgi:hypothetical protein
MPRLAGEVETTNRDVSSSLAIVHVPIDDLKADPANPRRISDAELEALTRSIREFGLIDPIIARKEDRTVIGGHQRLLVARRLGLKSVPVTFLDITKEKAQLLNVALNRISGSFDQELLARLMAGLNTTPDLDLTLSGFDDKDIKQMLRSLESREKRERPESFDLDAALRSAYENPRAQRGDLFRLGEHRVLCGDATSQEDVEKLLASTRCQMAFTDPPYNVSLGDHGGKQQGQARRRIANDSMDPEAWETFCRGWARSLVTYVDGALYICMSTKEWPTVSRILAEAGGHWSTTLIWEKDRFVLGRSDYQRRSGPGRCVEDRAAFGLASASDYEASPPGGAGHREFEPVRRRGARPLPRFRLDPRRRRAHRPGLRGDGARPPLLFHGARPLGGVHREQSGEGEGLMLHLTPLISRGEPC